MKIKLQESTKISSPLNAVNVFQSILKQSDKMDIKKEHFWSMGLNNNNTVEYVELVSLGTLNESYAHPREIFRFSIIKSVAGLILCHNHPSGTVDPSDHDKKITESLIKASNIIGIPILDHIVITQNNYFSFAENGLI